MANHRPSEDLIQGYYCPLPNLRLLPKWLANGKYHYEDGTLEKLCCRCNTYWPADTEFYFPMIYHNDGLHTCCKACYLERRYPERYGLEVSQ